MDVPFRRISFYLIIKMARTIKIFRFLQKYSRAIGIDSIESNKFKFGKSLKKFCFFMSEIQFIASLIAFMCYEATSIFEYGTTFFAIASSIFAVVSHFTYSWQIKNFFKFTAKCERFIEKRKCGTSM